MARGDGIDRVNVRNVNVTDEDIAKTQGHNEREKESYSNEDIVKERSCMNVYYKKPSGDYEEVFKQMVEDKIISTRGLKSDAIKYGELVFDVNTAYFYNHGGYDYAKQFFADSYRAAVQIVGGEQYIISAVMHADERNRAMSEKLGEDVYHYHMHVVYVPVVEKQILWSKRCKDKSLVGTVKETIMQVSHSKKWNSKPTLDENGKPLLRKDGKPVLRKSYGVLQDDYYEFIKNAGYTDVERGEKGSDEEHLTVTQFKVMKEQERLSELEHQNALQKQVNAKLQAEMTALTGEIADLDRKAEQAQAEVKEIEAVLSTVEKQEIKLSDVDRIQPKKSAFTGKVSLTEEEYRTLSTAAKKYVIYKRHDMELQKQVGRLTEDIKRKDSLIDKLKGVIDDLKSRIRGMEKKAEESIHEKLEHSRLKAENENLRKENQSLREILHALGISTDRKRGQRNIEL